MHILHRYLGYDYSGVSSAPPTFCVKLHPAMLNSPVKRIARYLNNNKNDTAEFPNWWGTMGALWGQDTSDH